MGTMRAASPCLPPISIAAACRDRHIPTKKRHCPCGKVVPTMQAQESKALGIHSWGAKHTDWVRCGKVVLEFFQGNVTSDTSLLSMLIRVDKHPDPLGAFWLA